jgi:hypothetical protein
VNWKVETHDDIILAILATFKNHIIENTAKKFGYHPLFAPNLLELNNFNMPIHDTEKLQNH